jgi:Holliday junction resolvase RusA-like endonuclease
LKAVLDGMAKALVYEDDSQIRDLRIRWGDTIGGMLKVKIEEM